MTIPNNSSKKEGGIKSLIKALKDEDAEIRREAAYNLGEMKDKRAVDPLIEALKDEDSSVREEAVWALAE
ncbi:MAG: HEAT repeat domain-containing protein, partial [Candidatus Wukongarchaeota archaeon]|nr:HEAT repeat domain-containing protein [Candidatus Wukongarchaeota archaeon]